MPFMPKLRLLFLSLSLVCPILLLPEAAMACEEVDPCKSSDSSYTELLVAGGLILAFIAFEIIRAMRNPFPSASPVDPNDPRTVGAKFKALASINEFWESYTNPAADEDGFALKIALPVEDGNEHIWIGEISERKGQLFGRLENEPMSDQLEYGQLIMFDHDQISDWTYEKAGVQKGNFSMAILLSELSDRKRKRALKLLGWTDDDLLVGIN
jgi:uncharacterized protein YegJ (DUF2314 family)